MSEDARTAPLALNIHYFIKWTLISVVIGLTVGAIGTVFGHGVAWATRVWNRYHWTVFLMPAAGLLIVWLYRACREEKKSWNGHGD